MYFSLHNIVVQKILTFLSICEKTWLLLLSCDMTFETMSRKHLINTHSALAVVAQWIEHRPAYTLSLIHI